jgi:hypothetical protein
MVSKEMAIKLKEIGLEWEPQRHDMYLKLYNQGCPMQPRCDINEVLSALPELIEREREAEKLIAAAEQRAEQAEKQILDAKNAVAKAADPDLSNWIHVSPLYVSINAVLGSLQEECKRAEKAETDGVILRAKVKQLLG